MSAKERARLEVFGRVKANRFLEEKFLPALNKRFAVSAAVEGDLHRPLEAGYDLDRAFSVQERRVVQSDWTVRWGNRFLQLERSSMGHVRPGGMVTVCEQGDGRIRVFTGEVELAWSETRREASRGSRRAARGREEIRSNQEESSVGGSSVAEVSVWEERCRGIWRWRGRRAERIGPLGNRLAGKNAPFHFRRVEPALMLRRVNDFQYLRQPPGGSTNAHTVHGP